MGVPFVSPLDYMRRLRRRQIALLNELFLAPSEEPDLIG